MLKQHRDSSHSKLDFVFSIHAVAASLEWLYSIPVSGKCKSLVPLSTTHEGNRKTRLFLLDFGLHVLLLFPCTSCTCTTTDSQVLPLSPLPRKQQETGMSPVLF